MMKRRAFITLLGGGVAGCGRRPALIAFGGFSVHLCAPKGLPPKSVRENRTVQSS